MTGIRMLINMVLLMFIFAMGQTTVADDLDWPEPKVENRPGAYWWWMGSAVDKENITYNLETMRKAGMGGSTIVPIYGVKGYEDKYIKHLSPEFVEMVSYAAQRGSDIYLQLKSGETRILRTFDNRKITSKQWRVLIKAGEPVTVKGTWKIKFVDGGPILPADITTTELKSWTEIGDLQAQRFAGTARYSIDIDIPKVADDWIIDLGDLRESGRVFINGKEAAALYSVPYSAPIGKHLKAGSNLLEIEVTNLSANRIRDLDLRKVKWQIFHDINFVNHNYKKFDASKWPLTPSGLLGPVTLTPMKHKY